MARKNNYRRNYRGTYQRPWSFAWRRAPTSGSYSRPPWYRRAGGYARKAYTRTNNGFGTKNFKLYPTMEFAAGAAVGLSNLDQKIPGKVILLGAALPMSGKIGHKVRNFFAGMILGELISQQTGFSIPFPAAASNTTTTQGTSVGNLYPQ